jgi:plasmid stabilization system protein ParE
LRVIVVGEARRDLAWWRRYYKHAFPESQLSASRHMAKTVGLLQENPFLGRSVENYDLRQLPVPNTPFKIIYRIRGETLEIVRIWDMRRQPAHGFQE